MVKVINYEINLSGCRICVLCKKYFTDALPIIFFPLGRQNKNKSKKQRMDANFMSSKSSSIYIILIKIIIFMNSSIFGVNIGHYLLHPNLRLMTF